MLHIKIQVPGENVYVTQKILSTGETVYGTQKIMSTEGKCICYTENSEYRGYVTQKIVSTEGSHSTQKFLSTGLNVCYTENCESREQNFKKPHYICVRDIEFAFFYDFF